MLSTISDVLVLPNSRILSSTFRKLIPLLNHFGLPFRTFRIEILQKVKPFIIGFTNIFLKKNKQRKDIEIENVKLRLRENTKSMINISLHEYVSVGQCHNKIHYAI